jgi:hypothetical protein
LRLRHYLEDERPDARGALPALQTAGAAAAAAAAVLLPRFAAGLEPRAAAAAAFRAVGHFEGFATVGELGKHEVRVRNLDTTGGVTQEECTTKQENAQADGTRGQKRRRPAMRKRANNKHKIREHVNSE